MRLNMTEPATTAAGGIALYKLGAFGFAAAFAAVVVMSLTLPKTVREFVVALICTLMASIGGGAAVIKSFDLITWADDLYGLCALLGLVFACGLPGWVLIRGFFAYAEYRKSGQSFIKMLQDLMGVVRAAVFK
ncbi:hypothetical protein FQZ97_983260 [compost metagenome]